MLATARGRELPAQPHAEPLDFVNLDEGATLRDVNNMLGRLGISKDVSNRADYLGAAGELIRDAGFDTYLWSDAERLDVHPGQHWLTPRRALTRFLNAIDSPEGVGRLDVTLAQLAFRAHAREAEAARLLRQLLNEITDDGPTDKTLYTAKREVES